MIPTSTTYQEAFAAPSGKHIITRFTDDRIAGKLMSMGVLPGSTLEVIRKAPLGGGWYVRIDSQILALRKEELDSIVTQQW